MQLHLSPALDRCSLVFPSTVNPIITATKVLAHLTLRASGTRYSMQHACGFDRSRPAEDRPPVGGVAAGPWA